LKAKPATYEYVLTRSPCGQPTSRSSCFRGVLNTSPIAAAFSHPQILARPNTSRRSTYRGSVQTYCGATCLVLGDCACPDCRDLDTLNPARRMAAATMASDGDIALLLHRPPESCTPLTHFPRDRV